MILNFYLPRGHDKSNVQLIGDITSFRIYDTYCHYDVKGHGAGVMPPRSMRVALGFFFSIFLQIFSIFSLFVSLFLVSFILSIYLIFSFWPCLFTKTTDKVKADFRNSTFQVYSAFGSFWCLPSMCLILILRAYKFTILAHTNKSTLTESANK